MNIQIARRITVQEKTVAALELPMRPTGFAIWLVSLTRIIEGATI